MSPIARKGLAWLLGAAFAACLVMGAGPGLLLVNGGESRTFGFPTVYMWGIGWFFGEVAVVLAAFFLLWRDRDEGAGGGDGA